MPIITFIHPDGTIQKVEGQPGETLLKIALDTGVPIEHACGGNGFCTTCLCSVQEGDMGKLSPRNDREENMGVVDDPSRLSCQTVVQAEDVTVTLVDI